MVLKCIGQAVPAVGPQPMRQTAWSIPPSLARVPSVLRRMTALRSHCMAISASLSLTAAWRPASAPASPAPAGEMDAGATRCATGADWPRDTASQPRLGAGLRLPWCTRRAVGAAALAPPVSSRAAAWCFPRGIPENHGVELPRVGTGPTPRHAPPRRASPSAAVRSDRISHGSPWLCP